MTIRCARCGKVVEVKPKAYYQKYCPECSAESKTESIAKSRLKQAKAKRTVRTNADLWAHAIKVMQRTGKSYAQCQVEGLFYMTEE